MIHAPPLPPRPEMYRALVQRDTSYDGVFFAAISTTGIFCRPTCGAKKPRAENVEFFPSTRDALNAGYRPCKRCTPLTPPENAPPWLRSLLSAIDNDPARRFTDADLRALGVDPGRVRRWFRTHHGMTFHAYQRARRLGMALGRLRRGDSPSRAAYEHGFESESGFREAFSRLFGGPPGRSRHAQTMSVTRLQTPLGAMVAGATDEGLCLLEFADRPMLETQIRRVRQRFDCAAVPGCNDHLERLDEELRAYFEGALQQFTGPLSLGGTPFQEACWAYLREIPYGETRSYHDQAHALGKRGAVRAVGRANGANRIAIVIPCHRVVRQDGQLAGYGGGLWRKRLLLRHEMGETRLGIPVERGADIRQEERQTEVVRPAAALSGE